MGRGVGAVATDGAAASAAARAVHEPAQRRLRHRGVDSRDRVGLVGDVRTDERALDLSGRDAAPVLVQIDDDDVPVLLLAQQPDGGLAEAGRPTGDDDGRGAL
jgi:hypothetical protein